MNTCLASPGVHGRSTRIILELFVNVNPVLPTPNEQTSTSN